MYLDSYKNKIIKLCKKYEVGSLYVFGSVLTDHFSKGSDIDFVVNINSKDPIIYAENYFALKFELEKLLNRKIDLLEGKALNNRFFLEIINNLKYQIYGVRFEDMAFGHR